MWPWEHLALGYVLYSVSTRATRGRAPEGPLVVFLALGTQFPDLIDKPLAWLGVLPSGRSLAHSVFVTALVVAVVLYATRERYTGAGGAFSFGYATHLLGDVAEPLVAGTYSAMTFLFWPLFGPSLPDTTGLAIERLLALQLADVLAADFHLFALVVLVWVVDGMPILSDAVGLLWRRIQPGSPG